MVGDIPYVPKEAHVHNMMLAIALHHGLTFCENLFYKLAI